MNFLKPCSEISDMTRNIFFRPGPNPNIWFKIVKDPIPIRDQIGRPMHISSWVSTKIYVQPVLGIPQLT